ncbi:endonuclease [Malaciobacter halophilus]|uniref:Endonuclease n=1 Tax=Malaciobacter halophilus TaxID=197482 RepID=A0A2N1J4J4_9BACT|nr:endonuclease/exonuclease/phosphatase family protein [Malaciobacter halophilus]AXH09438.1 endonuclease/exonuclease/phosphatase [Malaciobacter halophilus]PKI81488.1 endonuclease [Malaciobacter halophilus]
MNIKVGTFNLFQFVQPPFSWYIKKDRFTKEQWEEKTEFIKKQLLKMDCDIVAFQEVFSHEALEELTKQVGFKYFKIVDFAKKDKNNSKVFITTTVALASKYEITQISSLQINESVLKLLDIKESFYFSRLPIKAKIKIKNKELLTYVFHLKSNRLNEYEYKFEKTTNINLKLEKSIYAINNLNAKALKQRVAEAYHLAFDIIKNLNENDFIIALGDLNDRQNSLIVDILTNKSLFDVENFKVFKEIENKKEYYLFDSYEKALNKKNKKEPTSYFKAIGNIIDYIFVSKKIDVLEYKLFNEHLLKNKDGSILQSDHAQVVATLKF